MTTLNVTGLESLLGELGLQTPAPKFETADVLNKPLDIGRIYLASILSAVHECDPVTAYKAIQWPNNVDNGDLAAILPKLSQGSDSKSLAIDLVQKVRATFSVVRLASGA